MDALVIGAGICGLTTAVCLAEAGLSVTVRSSEEPERTTSAVAGAIAGGALFAEPDEVAASWPPAEKTTAWHRSSLSMFRDLAGQAETGVRIGRGRMVCAVGDTPSWGKALPNFAPCAPEEMAGYPVAFWIDLPVIDMHLYSAYLLQRLKNAGGTLEIGHVASLFHAAQEAKLVANCTGVAAAHMAADKGVFPVRGQHVVVENPGLEDFLFEYFTGSHRSPTFTAIIPHADRIVLGGTANRDDWSREPDETQTKEILRRCIEVEPRLAGAKVLGVEVGLRVARSQVRVEAEPLGTSLVLHNYGHGGAAVGMSWGCAQEVTALALAGRAG